MKVKNDHHSKFSSLSNWKEAWKKSGLQRDSNPWPLRYWCDALPTELWRHTIDWQLIDLTPNVWHHSSVGRALHWYRRGHGFESCWSPDFFQASSFQLLKLENLLPWSFFIFSVCYVNVHSQVLIISVSVFNVLPYSTWTIFLHWHVRLWNT